MGGRSGGWGQNPNARYGMQPRPGNFRPAVMSPNADPTQGMVRRPFMPMPTFGSASGMPQPTPYNPPATPSPVQPPMVPRNPFPVMPPAPGPNLPPAPQPQVPGQPPEFNPWERQIMEREF